MSVRSSTPLTPESARIFRERCAALGLHTWTVDCNGSVTSHPIAGGVFGEWLRGPITMQAVRRLLVDAHSSLEWVGHEPWRGCRLIAAPHMERRAVVERTIVLIPGAKCAACGPASLIPDGEAAPAMGASTIDVTSVESMLRWMLEDLVKADSDRATIDGFTREVLLVYEYIRLLYTLGRSMKTRESPEQFVSLCCRELQEISGYTWVCVKIGAGTGAIKGFEDVMIHAGDLPCEAGRFAELANATLATIESPKSVLIRPGVCGVGEVIPREAPCIPIQRGGAIIGAMFAANHDPNHGGVSSVETQLFDVAADLLGVFLDNAGLYADQRALFFGSLRALTAAIDAKDRYTCGHSERVAHLAASLARRLGMSDEEVERVHIAGLLHDVGKIGVPEAILTFPGRLNDEQFAAIREHPGIGHHILRDIRQLDDAKPGVLSHHERWDGRGYPRGLAGEDIPLLGRILALADTFDAMSSSRSYRPALAREKVLAEIERCAGSQFDPSLAPVFLSLDFTEFDEMMRRHRVEYSPDTPLAASA